MQEILRIKNLHVEVEGKEVLKGVNLSVGKGEVHVIMGPNGSGKSSLAHTIMGHPSYKVKAGDILFEGKSILNLDTDKRANLGIFLTFQYPVPVPGVSLYSLLRRLWSSRGLLSEKVEELKNSLDLKEEILLRSLNDGLSGGEKKKSEILQLIIKDPKLIILDEIDSGLDIDSLRNVAGIIEKAHREGKTILIITHYRRILDYLEPQKVHVMMDGRIKLSGGAELISRLEREGYRVLGGSDEEVKIAG